LSMGPAAGIAVSVLVDRLGGVQHRRLDGGRRRGLAYYLANVIASDCRAVADRGEPADLFVGMAGWSARRRRGEAPAVACHSNVDVPRGCRSRYSDATRSCDAARITGFRVYGWHRHGPQRTGL